MNRKSDERQNDKKVVVYVASHIKHTDFWRDLRSSGISISSTWIDHPANRNDADAISRLWVNCFEEIRRSDMILVRTGEEDRLKGVLIEIGGGLVLGKPVYLIGNDENIGDACNHPLFHRVVTPSEAIAHFVSIYQ